jgi:hypothetical protein
MIPECAKWEIWRGAEIEGVSGLGDETLFIRKFDTTPESFAAGGQALIDKMTHKGMCRRVWFCKEFTNWGLLRVIARHFKTVCIEATPKTYDNLPRDFKANFTIYLKLNFLLKEGDHVCVGASFQDEAFCVGTGAKVRPEQYANDVKIR